MKKMLCFIIALSIILSYSAIGCSKKTGSAVDRKLVARINNYELTVDDFRDEARTMFSDKYTTDDPQGAKESLLDEVILKKIMLQEAQAQNFDKNEAFMAEIERYWEQALLKLLIKEKMQEFLQKTKVSDGELKQAYEKMKVEEGDNIQPLEELAPSIRSEIRREKVQENFNRWIESMKRNANVKVYKENLKYVIIK